MAAEQSKEQKFLSEPQDWLTWHITMHTSSQDLNAPKKTNFESLTIPYKV
jgi:hypothetical protein